MGGTGIWLLLVLASVAVALVVLLRPRTPVAGDEGRADTILAEQLAAGQISETEFRERSAVLAAHRPRQRARWWPTIAAAVAVVVALVLAVGAVTGGPGTQRWGPMRPMPDMHGMTGEPAADGEAPAALPDATEITIEAGDMWFAPDVIEVTAGEPVNLTVDNQGQVFHDLVIDELDLRIPVDAGQTAAAGIRIDQPGDYGFYCSVPGHATAGMRGTLTAHPATS